MHTLAVCIAQPSTVGRGCSDAVWSGNKTGRGCYQQALLARLCKRYLYLLVNQFVYLFVGSLQPLLDKALRHAILTNPWFA